VIKTTFKTAIRSYRRYWLNTTINICGLGISLALSILLALFIRHEKGIDRFNRNYERIFFLSQDKDNSTSTVAAVGPMIAQKIPDVESFLRFDAIQRCIVKYQGKSDNIDLTVLSDSSLFHFFDLKLIEGDKQNALVAPLSVVITSKTAKKIFGEENPIGKRLLLNVFLIDSSFELRVTGIIDNLPSNTHLKADMFISLNSLPVFWSDPNFFNRYNTINYKTYLMLAKGTDRDAAVEKINRLTQEEGERLNVEYLKKNKFRLSTIQELYFSRSGHFFFKQGNLSVIRIFSALAIIILLIAIINYINLSTSQAFSRSHILAIKKTFGENRRILFGQIIFESVLISAVAINMAVVLIELIKPVFNRIMNVEIRVGYFENPALIPLFMVIGILVGIVSGVYPAFYISKFDTIRGLSKEIIIGKRGILVRSLLMIIQFVVASFMITATLTIIGQMRYVRAADLGFNEENLLYLTINGELSEKKDVLKQELLKNPSVKYVSCSFGSYCLPSERRGFDYNGEELTMQIERADKDYINTLGIQIIKGRDFLDNETDKGNIIINETANERYFNGNGLGCTLDIVGRNNLVIGIVKDYNFQTLHYTIEPLGIINGDLVSLLNIRVDGQNTEKTLREIRNVVDEILPGYPLELNFVDQHFISLYFKEQQLGKIFTFFALAAIFIACMGVLGLVSFAFQSRTKEVGIRKIHGATATEIIQLLTLDLSRYIIIANIIAIPLSWIFMKKWLTGFAYNAGINYWYFTLAILLTWLVAQLVVLYQTLKSAWVNPVEVLKAE